MSGVNDSGVSLTVDEHVARVTIDRPHVLNAVGDQAQRRLDEIWQEISEDQSIWVTVLTGAGDRAFCAGSDMSTGAQEKSGVDFWMSANPNGYCGLTMRDSLTTPVVARVNGYALGGGMELVLGCDIVVAAKSAQFGLVEPRVGRMAFDAAALLPRRIPYTAAMGLLLTGRRATAAEMKSLGLVNEVAKDGELDAAVDGWVQQILACAPTSVRATKELGRTTAHLPPRTAVAQRLPEYVTMLRSPNAEEGVAAFKEKRKPKWTDV